MKILIVDDHALVREGLRQVLKGFDEVAEVLDASTCAQAFELAGAHPDLDLVLLDYQLPDMTGQEALGHFGKNHPELPIIMLSGSVNPQMMRQALTHGAAGFVTKTARSSELLLAVQQVLAGDVYLPPELLAYASTAQAQSTDATPRPSLGFTPRQEEVLYLMLDGRSNKEISQILDLAEDTTKNHVTAILRRFGVKTRVQAVLAASRFGYARAEPTD